MFKKLQKSQTETNYIPKGTTDDHISYECNELDNAKMKSSVNGNSITPNNNASHANSTNVSSNADINKNKNSKKNNKLLTSMLKINVDAINNDTLAMNISNKLGQSPMNAAGIKFDIIKPNTGNTNYINNRLVSPDSTSAKIPETRKASLNKVLFKDLKRNSVKFMLNTQSTRNLKDSELIFKNISPCHEQKMDQINKIYQDASFLKHIRIRRAPNKSLQNNSSFMRLSHQLSNSPNASNTPLAPFNPKYKKSNTMTNKPVNAIFTPQNDSKMFNICSGDTIITATQNKNPSQQLQFSEIKRKKHLSLGSIGMGGDLIINENTVEGLYDGDIQTANNNEKMMKKIANKNNSFEDGINKQDNKDHHHYHHGSQKPRKGSLNQQEYAKNIEFNNNNNDDNDVNTSIDQQYTNYSVEVSEEGNEGWIEYIMRNLIAKKDLNIEVFYQIRAVFDKIIENKKLSSTEFEKNLPIIKKLKLIYEKYIENLSMKKNNIELSRMKKEINFLREENLLLVQKNLGLQNTIDELCKDQSRANYLSSSKTTAKICLSPSRIASNVDKRQQDQGYESSHIPLSIEKVNQEYLKHIIINQQHALNLLKKKESMLIRLIKAIKNQGIDIEKVYNKELQRVPDISNKGVNRKILNHYQTKVNENKIKDIKEADNILEDRSQKSSKLLLRHDTNNDNENQYDILDVKPSVIVSPSHANLPQELKNKLKLDLSVIKNSLPTNPIIQIHNPNLMAMEEVSSSYEVDYPIEFHKEFMSNIEGFSLSWRQAAINEKK